VLSGDVIIISSPDEPSKLICKRIIAGPGDTLLAPDRLDRGHGCHVERMVTIPPGHVWVSGDNLAASVDSRTFGPVPYQLLKGRPFLLVRSWPSLRLMLSVLFAHSTNQTY
jgi:mitochondrial inner membrane protease subunit 1